MRCIGWLKRCLQSECARYVWRLRLDQVFRVEIAVRPHRLVQILLRFEACVALRNLFLQIQDCHLPQLDLLNVGEGASRSEVGDEMRFG